MFWSCVSLTPSNEEEVDLAASNADDIQLAKAYLKMAFGCQQHHDSSPSNSKEGLSSFFQINEEKYEPEVTLVEIQEYLERLADIGELSKEIIGVAIIIGARLLKIRKFKYKRINHLKVLAVATFVAQKIMEEIEQWRIQEFSEIAGVSKKWLRTAEINFLVGVEFRVHVTARDYKRVQQIIG